MRQALPAHTSEVTAASLALHNYNGAFTRSTSAIYYLPEGTGARICGATFNEREPSWDVNVPDRVQSADVTAPDGWEAVVTVRHLSTFGPGSVQLAASGQLGDSCGWATSWNLDHAASDTPTITPADAELCQLGGQNIRISAETWHAKKDGTGSREASRAQFLLMGDSCTGDCPAPANRTYTVPLPGLGQDPCPGSATDTCDTPRRTMAALATIDVTWRSSGDSHATSWNVSATSDEDTSSVAPETPRFDVDSTLTSDFARNDNFRTTATGTIQFDRLVTFTAEAVGPCYTDGATTSTVHRPLLAGVDGCDSRHGQLHGPLPWHSLQRGGAIHRRRRPLGYRGPTLGLRCGTNGHLVQRRP